MKKIPKMNGVVRGTCYEIYRNIPQKTRMKKLAKTNSLTRYMFFGTSAATSYK